MVVTIKEFQRNLYKYIHSKEDLVVTSNGKSIFKVLFEVVTTSKVVTKVATPDVKPHKDLIKDLQFQIDTVKPIEKKTIQWCQGCKAYGKYTEATHQTEVFNNEGVRTVWLCDKCESKISV